jgi:hypothetical protein
MCLTCGCGDAHKSMGKNITFEDLRDVAVENDTRVDEILRVMTATAAQDRGRHTEEYSQVWTSGSAAVGDFTAGEHARSTTSGEGAPIVHGDYAAGERTQPLTEVEVEAAPGTYADTSR